ncbi:39S ribosomal protein L10 [Blattella germanica]|nr:39S ribosomal protein L10 [Blattella germanica]
MSAITIKAILQPRWCSSLQFVRFRKRINIQRPAKPHYERAKVLEVCKPYYIDPRQGMSLADLCEKPLEIQFHKDEEGKVQNLATKTFPHCNNSILKEDERHLLAKKETTRISKMLKKQNMYLKQYGKKVLQLAVENTKYEAVLQLFTSHNFMVLSPEQKLGKLLKLSKKMPQMVLMDLPTAQAGVVAVLESVAANLRQNLLHHQQTLVSHLEKHYELQQKALDEKD